MTTAALHHPAAHAGVATVAARSRLRWEDARGQHQQARRSRGNDPGGQKARGHERHRAELARRVQQLGVRPLQVSEFLGPLSRTNYTWPEEWHELRDFDHFITGEKARMDKAKDATAE